MIANRTKCSKLQSLSVKLSKLLISCKKEIMKQEKRLADNASKPIPKQQMYRLGTPYFKDRQCFPCPWNTDVYRKKENKEFIGADSCMEHIKSAWKKVDQSRLLVSVKKSYINYIILQKEDVIKSLKTCSAALTSKADKECIQEKIAEVELSVCKLKCTDVSIKVPDSFMSKIDWETISTTKMGSRHSPMECRAFWNICVSPKVNKETWTRRENEQLVQLVEKYKFQDWDTIAEKLGTKRSGYITCIHFYTKLCQKHEKFKKFTQEEDQLLKEVVDNIKIGTFVPWSLASFFFENRSKAQLYNRYTIYLVNQEVKKGKFSDVEGIFIQYLYTKLNGNWQEIAKHIPDRSFLQVKNHFLTCINHKNDQQGSWTVQQDKDILKHVKLYGAKQWGSAIKLIESGRSTANLRHRYAVLKKWMEKHPGMGLKYAPRRQMGTHLQGRKIKEHIKNAVLDRLNREEVIPNIKTVENYYREAQARKAITDFNEEEVDSADEALIEFFQTETSNQPYPIKANENVIESATRGVETLLSVFGAKLTIPPAKEIDAILGLDEHDKKILNALKQDEETPQSVSVSHLIPPNAVTMLAFKNIITAMDVFKTQSEGLLLEKESDDVSETELQLFQQRFRSLFKLPAFLSISDVPEAAVNRMRLSETNAPKQYGRPKNETRFWKVGLMMTKRWQKYNKNVTINEEEDEDDPETVEKSVKMETSTESKAEEKKDAKEVDLEVAKKSVEMEKKAVRKPINTYSRKTRSTASNSRSPVASTSAPPMRVKKKLEESREPRRASKRLKKNK